jgi:hypothetical protein
MPLVYVDPYKMLLEGSSLKAVAAAMASDHALQQIRIEYPDTPPASSAAPTLPSARGILEAA